MDAKLLFVRLAAEAFSSRNPHDFRYGVCIAESVEIYVSAMMAERRRVHPDIEQDSLSELDVIAGHVMSGLIKRDFLMHSCALTNEAYVVAKQIAEKV